MNSRQQFESWYREARRSAYDEPDLGIDSRSQYLDTHAHEAWLAWQASRACATPEWEHAPELHQMPDLQPGRSEAAVSADAVRQARELHGAYLFRNNSGAYTDEKGNHVRYGLGNISKQVNDVMKTPDYVGIWPFHCRDFVTHEPITIGQFVGIEMKKEGWTFTGKGRERGQMNFGELVIKLGGRFMFHSGGPLL